MTCTFEGEKYLPAGMNAEEVCQTFEQRLASIAQSTTPAINRNDLVLAVSLSQRGSLLAKVSIREGDKLTKLHDIGLSVMDREVRREDFTELAKVVGNKLLKR